MCIRLFVLPEGWMDIIFTENLKLKQLKQLNLIMTNQSNKNYISDYKTTDTKQGANAEI